MSPSASRDAAGGLGGGRRPNQRLRGLLGVARWTGQQLADAVNVVGAEAGVPTSYDRTAVAHWLAGTRPRSPTPELIAEAFTRRLARPLSTAALGLAEPPEHPPQPAVRRPADVGAELTALIALQTASALPMRPALAYRVTALAVPSWTQASDEVARRPPAARSRRLGPVGAVDADGAEAIGRVFAAADNTHGGGYTRRPLGAYLARDLAPKLNAGHDPALRRRLLTSATELAHLCAFMCFDDEAQPLAQRYYLTALQMAAENTDAVSYAITLRGMSVQAHALGHHSHALQLAEQAISTAAFNLSAAHRAFLYGQLAVAQAADGDRTRALATLITAERHLDRLSSTTLGLTVPLIGDYNPAALALQRAAVRDLLGDAAGAITALHASLRHRPVVERRSRAISLARLAELQLRTGHLEQATTTWHHFLDDLYDLRCGRATTALKAMRAQLRPYARSPAAATLLHRATAFTTSAPGP